MSDVLTEKQEAVRDFIEEYQLNYGKSPTLKEMREHFKVSSDNSILKHLKALEEKGVIEKDDTPRGIKMLKAVRERFNAAAETLKLPILGAIPAGGPVLTDEYIENWVNIGADIAGSGALKNPNNYFMLRVTGNSMIDAGIFEGDLVIANSKKQPQNGDIVVALIDEANTLKRLVKQNGRVYLKAENPQYKDIYPLSELSVQGVVTALIRQY
ncbi:MAG: transcriptional repressor LexA [Candidatus Gracilibacteria bacterium]|jgi:repressor LexA